MNLIQALIETREAVMINRMAYDRAQTRYSVLLDKAAVEIKDLSVLPDVIANRIRARKQSDAAIERLRGMEW